MNVKDNFISKFVSYLLRFLFLISFFSSHRYMRETYYTNVHKYQVEKDALRSEM